MAQIGEVKSFGESIKLDKKDRKILSLLMLNARISLAELAKHVELSKSNISRRISRLEKQGFIKGYHAFVDVSKIGIKFELNDCPNKKLNGNISIITIEIIKLKNHIKLFVFLSSIL